MTRGLAEVQNLCFNCQQLFMPPYFNLQSCDQKAVLKYVVPTLRKKVCDLFGAVFSASASAGVGGFAQMSAFLSSLCFVHRCSFGMLIML